MSSSHFNPPPAINDTHLDKLVEKFHLRFKEMLEAKDVRIVMLKALWDQLFAALGKITDSGSMLSHLHKQYTLISAVHQLASGMAFLNNQEYKDIAQFVVYLFESWITFYLTRCESAEHPLLYDASKKLTNNYYILPFVKKNAQPATKQAIINYLRHHPDELLNNSYPPLKKKMMMFWDMIAKNSFKKSDTFFNLIEKPLNEWLACFSNVLDFISEIKKYATPDIRQLEQHDGLLRAIIYILFLYSTNQLEEKNHIFKQCDVTLLNNQEKTLAEFFQLIAMFIACQKRHLECLGYLSKIKSILDECHFSISKYFLTPDIIDAYTAHYEKSVREFTENYNDSKNEYEIELAKSQESNASYVALLEEKQTNVYYQFEKNHEAICQKRNRQAAKKESVSIPPQAIKEEEQPAPHPVSSPAADLYNKGLAALQEARHEEAERYFSECVKLSSQQKCFALEIQADIGLSGAAYLAAAYALKKNCMQAYAYFESALKINVETQKNLTAGQDFLSKDEYSNFLESLKFEQQACLDQIRQIRIYLRHQKQKFELSLEAKNKEKERVKNILGDKWYQQKRENTFSFFTMERMQTSEQVEVITGSLEQYNALYIQYLSTPQKIETDRSLLEDIDKREMVKTQCQRA